MNETEVGVVTHFFSRIGVAGIKLTAPVSIGDILHIKGHTTDVTIKVESMQVEHRNVQSAVAGEIIGIKVPERVRERDRVYKKESSNATPLGP